MNAIIQITTNEQGSQVVSARATYQSLELAEGQFTRWTKSNIEDNPFAIEGVDFERLDIIVETPNGGKKVAVDYALHMDFAKKLCMVSKSAKGEEVRDYFLRCEREAQKNTTEQLPASQDELILMLAQRNVAIAKDVFQLQEEMREIRQIQAESKAELLALPAPTEPLAEMAVEDKVRRIVNTYASATVTPIQDVWRSLYTELYYRYRVQVNGYKRNPGESKLQMLKRVGHLDKLYVVATNTLQVAA